MINYIKIITLLMFSIFILSGCATWSHSSVEKHSDIGKNIVKTDAKKIIISKEDITDRPYTILADITAVVNKTTAFHANPTPELVNEKLKQEAAKLGADAVILVRYGKEGVSLMSWGSLEGKGRAIKFN